MFPATAFQGRRIAVFGLARSGISCAKALMLGGADVLAWDDSDASQQVARAEGLPVVNLHDVDFSQLDGLVLSPGIPLTHPAPHWTVIKAHAAKIEVIGDTEVFARQMQGTGARIVGVTGTNGKSTTTALIGHVLTQGGLDVQIGGNIGLAAFNLSEPRAGRVYVLELSSFQIDLMPSLKPDVGILTNLTPDHLDRHGTMENYAAVKARLFAQQSKGDTAVIGVDDPWCAAISEQVSETVDLRRVSVVNHMRDGISTMLGVLVERRGGKVIDEIDLRVMSGLRGKHNWQNAAMAYGAARALGLSADVAKFGMSTFPGLSHRMQEVARAGTVSFVNDSKATNADAAEKALSSFENIYWIAGGIAKSGGIESLRPLFPAIRKAYLVGVAADDFAKALEGEVAHDHSGSLDIAVKRAFHDAKASGLANAVVLLSPACASFDQYKNFEVRGDAFVKAVSEVPGVRMLIGEKVP